jgi:hypothetical protein
MRLPDCDAIIISFRPDSFFSHTIFLCVLCFFSFCSQAVDRILAHLRARFATYFAMFEQYAQKNVFHVPELDFSVRLPKHIAENVITYSCFHVFLCLLPMAKNLCL